MAICSKASSFGDGCVQQRSALAKNLLSEGPSLSKDCSLVYFSLYHIYYEWRSFLLTQIKSNVFPCHFATGSTGGSCITYYSACGKVRTKEPSVVCSTIDMSYWEMQSHCTTFKYNRNWRFSLDNNRKIL